MIVFAVISALLAFLEWFLGLFDALPDVVGLVTFSLTIPVPIVGETGATMLDDWWELGRTVCLTLVAGKVLQWVYSVLPFKGT